MKILLAIDGTESSETATQILIAQARPAESQVKVVHVVNILTNQLPEMRRYSPGTEHGRDAQLKAAEALVEKTADTLRSKGFAVTTAIKWGRVESQIIAAAREWNADLIVLGSHDRMRFGRFMARGILEGVMRHSPCSVEIARVHSTY